MIKWKYVSEIQNRKKERKLLKVQSCKFAWLYLERCSSSYLFELTLPVPIPDEEKKLSEIFIFILLCGASKSFMTALKAFVKPFEAAQRGVKIKI